MLFPMALTASLGYMCCVLWAYLSAQGLCFVRNKDKHGLLAHASCDAAYLYLALMAAHASASSCRTSR